jgi:oligo-alginate lyase
MKRWLLFILLLLTTAGFGCAGEFISGKRQPQWPLKSSRVLLNDEQIAKARRLCDEDASAKSVREKILKDCDYWLAKSDQELHDLLPDYRVPRDFDASADGCPVHSTAIYSHGTYPWKLDREHPFTITCPLGGEKYPSNDFEAYYRSGMTNASLLTGPYADAGRGWVAPDGKRFWLVAYACHWNWMNTWLPTVNTLGQAYVLTGDPRYARKAIVMLDRIAEIYPGMDYATQSRYGELMKGKYHGKISNLIWETVVLKDLAIAYDRVFPALIGESATSLPWRSAEQIRTNIEANLLEEGLDGIESEKIAGNFGLHQNAQIYTALVRQNGPTKELLRGIFEQTGKTLRHEGLNYALYNLIYKDGMPYETSPNYGSGWVHCFVTMADPLKLAGYDLYALPRMKGVFDGFLDLICAGQFTPAIGDSGSIHAGWITPGFQAYEAAYREYREPRFAWAMCHWTKLETDSIESFDDLFKEPVITAARRDAAKYHHQPRSRLLDGFGTAILNNRRDSLAVSLFYGERNVHAHFDRLNLEVFGYGRRLSPDLGYPDQTDAFHAGIFSWSHNTISHNCLVVDQTRQRGAGPGKVLRFHDSPTVHVLDVDAAGTYPQADVYRRTLVLVDTSEEHSYLVDVVRVRGGTNHCLSLHGAEAEFTLSGSALPPPVTEGTLAGRDVSLGALYDDPVSGAPGFRGPYKGYNGSGYSHFFNWQRTQPQRTVAGQWQFGGESAAGLRAHVMPCAGQELVVADAYVSPQKKIPTVLKYMLVQRGASDRGNTFVTVWEPYGDKSQIDSVELVGADALTDCQAEVTIGVKRGKAVDTISIAASAGRMRVVGPQCESDAAVTVVSREDGVRTRTFTAGGAKLVANGEVIRVPPSLSGTVRAANYAAKTITIKPGSSIADATALVGHNVRLFNGQHSCIYPVSAARMKDGLIHLELGGREPITGRMRVNSVDVVTGTISTSSYRPCPASVSGMHLASKDLKHTAMIMSLKGKSLQLTEPREMQRIAKSLKPSGDDDLWIVDFGVGDKAEIEVFTHEAKVTTAPLVGGIK